MLSFTERLKKVVRENFVDVAPDAHASVVTGAALAEPVTAAVTDNVPESVAVAPIQRNAVAVPPPGPRHDPYRNTVDEVVPTAATPVSVETLVSETGDVDFDRLFEGVSPVSDVFNAGKAAEIVASLPFDLPMRVKRLTIKTTLETLADSHNTTITDAANAILSDAAQRMLRIARLQETIDEHADAQKTRIKAHVETLESEARTETATAQARIEEEFAPTEARLEQELDALLERIRALQAEAEALAARRDEMAAEKVAARGQAETERNAALDSDRARMRTLLEQLEQKRDEMQQACRVHMNTMNDVVLFFDETGSSAVASFVPPPVEAPDSETDPDELPAFMREDTALKLLGLQNGAAPR